MRGARIAELTRDFSLSDLFDTTTPPRHRTRGIGREFCAQCVAPYPFSRYFCTTSFAAHLRIEKSASQTSHSRLSLDRYAPQAPHRRFFRDFSAPDSRLQFFFFKSCVPGLARQAFLEELAPQQIPGCPRRRQAGSRRPEEAPGRRPGGAHEVSMRPLEGLRGSQSCQAQDPQQPPGGAQERPRRSPGAAKMCAGALARTS